MKPHSAATRKWDRVATCPRSLLGCVMAQDDAVTSARGISKQRGQTGCKPVPLSWRHAHSPATVRRPAASDQDIKKRAYRRSSMNQPAAATAARADLAVTSRSALSSSATLEGMRTSTNYSCNKSKLPMMAGLESAEASRTMSIGKNSSQFVFTVVTSDATCSDFLPKVGLRYARQFCGSTQTQQITSEQHAGDFEHQETLLLWPRHGHRGQHIIRYVQGQSHARGHAPARDASRP